MTDQAPPSLLNTLRPAEGSKKPRRRVGRGMGSGLGKTCGSGHKGQLSRSGGSVGPGFEGGQMPIHRRLPKQGFQSRTNQHTERLRMAVLNRVPASDRDSVDLALLKQLGLVKGSTRQVKLYLSGSIDAAYTLLGISVTAGVKAAIEKEGGQVSA